MNFHLISMPRCNKTTSHMAEAQRNPKGEIKMFKLKSLSALIKRQ